MTLYNNFLLKRGVGLILGDYGGKICDDPTPLPSDHTPSPAEYSDEKEPLLAGDSTSTTTQEEEGARMGGTPLTKDKGTG